MPTKKNKSKTRCWAGYEPVPGKKPGTKGSCRKASGSSHKKKAA